MKMNRLFFLLLVLLSCAWRSPVWKYSSIDTQLAADTVDFDLKAFDKALDDAYHTGSFYADCIIPKICLKSIEKHGDSLIIIAWKSENTSNYKDVQRYVFLIKWMSVTSGAVKCIPEHDEIIWDK
jgi:hypothetical protein